MGVLAAMIRPATPQGLAHRHRLLVGRGAGGGPGVEAAPLAGHELALGHRPADFALGLLSAPCRSRRRPPAARSSRRRRMPATMSKRISPRRTGVSAAQAGCAPFAAPTARSTSARATAPPGRAPCLRWPGTGLGKVSPPARDSRHRPPGWGTARANPSTHGFDLIWLAGSPRGESAVHDQLRPGDVGRRLATPGTGAARPGPPRSPSARAAPARRTCS